MNPQSAEIGMSGSEGDPSGDGKRGSIGHGRNSSSSSSPSPSRSGVQDMPAASLDEGGEWTYKTSFILKLCRWYSP